MDMIHMFVFMDSVLHTYNMLVHTFIIFITF